MIKVAGVTVLYNPDEETVSNILSYLNQLERLYIFDNSEEEIKSVTDKLRSYKQVKFLDNIGNIGIAAALNKSSDQAVKDSYDLLLTMDQDSRISKDYVNEMLKEFEKDKKIGVLAPYIVHTKNPKKPENLNIEEVTVAMTSGSMIRLSAYKEIRGFLEKFFIDYVDNEFCLRMHLSGYKVLQLNSVNIYHKLGEVKSRNFFLKKVFPTNHSPLRWYYRTRNRFYVYKTYKNQFPGYVRFDRILFLKELVKIFLYETNKLIKFKMIFKGYIDYRKDKFGKFK